MPYPLPLTRTEAYLAYKAGVIQQSDLKPSLAVPRNGIDAWLAYWTGLAADYPKREDGTPHILQEEEAYIAYLCGVINEYPEKCLRRVGAYLRYLISARWGRPDHPLNREELYLSLIKTQFIPSGDPSSDITINGTAKAAFVDVKMYGDTFQQSYAGANLYNATPYSTGQQGIATTIKDGYIFELSGTSTTTYSNIANWTNVNLPAGTYTFCIDHTRTQNITMRLSFDPDTQDVVIAPGDTSKTVTVSSPIVAMRPFIATGGSGRVIDETIKLNIVAGSTPVTVFEPYVGGIASPNPDYPQPIQTVTGLQTVEVAGKNMLNIDGFAATDSYAGLTVQLVNKDESTGTIGLKLTGNVSITLWSIYAQTGNIQLKPNTGYILSRTFTESGGLRNAGGIRIKVGSSYRATTTDASAAFTTDSTGIVQILIYAAYNQQGPTSDIDSTVIFYNLLLEEGSTVTAFAPYSKHTHEINLGKNLFDKSKQVSGWLNDTGGISQPTSTTDKTSDYMPCSSNASYVLSSPGFYLKIAQYDANKAFIKLDQSGNNIPSLTVNTAENAVYIRISYGNAQKEPNVQFEAGSVASAYAPYFEPIELCKLGSYQDYIWEDGEDWKVHKEVGKVVKTGDLSESWSKSNSTANNLFIGLQTDMLKDNSQLSFKVYSDRFLYKNRGTIYAQSIVGITTQTTGAGDQAMMIGLGLDSSVNTVALFRAWLSENPTTVYYPLATPTDTVITNQALIDQLNALKNGGAENGTTYIKVNATDPNLPGLLYVEAPKYE